MSIRHRTKYSEQEKYLSNEKIVERATFEATGNIRKKTTAWSSENWRGARSNSGASNARVIQLRKYSRNRESSLKIYRSSAYLRPFGVTIEFPTFFSSLTEEIIEIKATSEIFCITFTWKRPFDKQTKNYSDKFFNSKILSIWTSQPDDFSRRNCKLSRFELLGCPKSCFRFISKWWLYAQHFLSYIILLNYVCSILFYYYKMDHT